MKQLRTWFIYLFLMISTGVLSIYLVWNFTPVKDDIKKTLVLKLRPYLGEDFLLHDFSLGFGYVAFHKVTTSNSSQSYKVKLDEIQIGYDVLKFLKYNFEPLKVINSVTLKNPSIILYQSKQTKQVEIKDDTLSTDQVIHNVLRDIQRIPNINRIQVSGADVYWEKQDEKRIQIFDNLKGYLISLENGEIELDLLGNFHGSTKSSIILNGIINLTGENLNAWLQFNECILSSDFPFLKNGIYSLESARLNGELYMFSNAFNLDSLKLNGMINVKELSGLIYNQHTRVQNFDMNISGLNILFENINGEIEDGTFEFKGSIQNIFNPVVDWKLSVKDFSAKYLKQTHDIFEYALDGKLSGHGEFHGPLDSIKVNAKVQSPEILYAIVPFKNVQAELNCFQKVLNFSSINADFKEFRTNGCGEIDFNESQLRFLLTSDLKVPPNTFQIIDRVNESDIIIETDFSGDFLSKKFFGRFNYFFKQEDDNLLEGNGPFTLDDQFLTFSTTSHYIEDTLTLSGNIQELFNNPTFNILQVQNFPLKQLTTNPIIQDFADENSVNLDFIGPYNLLTSQLSIISRSDKLEIFGMSGNITEVFSDLQKFKGEFRANTAPVQVKGDVELTLNGSGLKADLSLADIIKGNLKIDFTNEAPLEGKLFVSRFSVSDYLANNPKILKNLQQGFVQGEMDVSGTLKNPTFKFNLSAEEFIVNDVGYYSTQVTGEVKDKYLAFDNFWVRLNNTPIFNANFGWNFKTDSLIVKIVGDNIESNFLAETLFKEKELIRGYFSYEVDAIGPVKKPVIQGSVTVRNGVLKDNPFEYLHVSFEDSIPPYSELVDVEKHIIKINEFEYVDKKNFTVKADGLIGLASDGILDLKINVDGNILAELPRILPYFKNSQSDGELFFQIEGTRSLPAITKADLKINDGSLEFESVIPPLKNLKAQIELLNENKFVSIKTIEGTLENRKAKIYNIEEINLTDRNLSPLLFEDFGLNFGILILETDPKGIPLSIPGMIQEGDIGYFAAKGKHNDEKFYFSGPPDKPFVRGTIELYDSRVTFPFIGMEEDIEGAPNPVVEFLMNTEWDVIGLAGAGNRYFIEIPAYVGETYMDLNIDNVSEGLTFSGKMNDESFRVEGSVESSRGRVEYLDVNFRVERFGVEFSRFELYPTVYGKAYTTVRDSTGQFPRDIYLVLYAIDPETNQEIDRGRWEDFRFKLISSDRIEGETQEQVLAYMGYSVGNIPSKASEVGLTMTENFLMRPIVRPIERHLERGLGLDYVRLKAPFTSNLFYFSMQNRLAFINNPYYLNANLNNNLNPALLLFQSSELTVGKYLVRDLYLTYTGQLLSGYDESKIESPRLGFYHRFGVEYRLLRNLLLEIEYDSFQLKTYYYNRADLNDFRIRLRHSFHF